MLSTDIQSMKNLVACPRWSYLGSPRQLLYGMPGDPLDREDYRLGSCCINKDNPESTCVNCGWKRFHEERGSLLDE